MISKTNVWKSGMITTCYRPTRGINKRASMYDTHIDKETSNHNKPFIQNSASTTETPAQFFGANRHILNPNRKLPNRSWNPAFLSHPPQTTVIRPSNHGVLNPHQSRESRPYPRRPKCYQTFSQNQSTHSPKSSRTSHGLSSPHN